MTLNARSHTLLEATNGVEALDTTLRERQDLILMDVELPKMNGLAVTRKLRNTPGFSQVFTQLHLRDKLCVPRTDSIIKKFMESY